MKKIFFLTVLLLLTISCYNTQKQNINNEQKIEEIVILRGDYIYYDDAAVLQTPKHVYGVIMNDKVNEINIKAKQLQDSELEFVDITVKGILISKPTGEIGWPVKVEITELIEIIKKQN